VFIPAIDFFEEVLVPKDTVQTGVSAEQLDGEIAKATRSLELVREEGFADDTEAIEELSTRLDRVQTELAEGRSDFDRRMQVLGNLRKVLREVDRLSDSSEWPRTEAELKEALYRLEEAHGKFGEASKRHLIEEMRSHVEEVIADKDPATATTLIDTMRSAHYELMSQQVGFWLGYLENLRENNDALNWTDRRRAQELMRQGVQVANQNPSISSVRPIVQELLSLLPNEERIRAEAGGTVSR
jgi:molecular chaperone DnaK